MTTGRGRGRSGGRSGRGGNRQAPKQLTDRTQGAISKASGSNRGRGSGPVGRGSRGTGGRGRNTPRGRGGRGQGGPRKLPSQADLDEELDKYMLRDTTYASKKLDDDLDDYFKAKKSEPADEKAAEEEQKD